MEWLRRFWKDEEPQSTHKERAEGFMATVQGAGQRGTAVSASNETRSNVDLYNYFLIPDDDIDPELFQTERDIINKQAGQMTVIRVFVYGNDENRIKRTYKKINRLAKKYDATDCKSIPQIHNIREDTNLPPRVRESFDYKYTTQRLYDFTD